MSLVWKTRLVYLIFSVRCGLTHEYYPKHKTVFAIQQNTTNKTPLVRFKVKSVLNTDFLKTEQCSYKIFIEYVLTDKKSSLGD